jgi:hypothetical protein
LGLILSRDELRELCGGRVQRAAQRAVLDHLGVPYKTRPDGSIVVFRVAAERVGLAMVGGNEAGDASRKDYDVNVEGLRRKHGKTANPR